jgi:LmbE family N-acetylglucosaminyl deacetylase
MPSRRALLTAAAAVSAIGTQAGCERRSNAAPPAKFVPARSGRPWILVVPHPDDETLGAGVPVAEHIAAGRDVHILLLTRGMGSVARLQINGSHPSRWWGLAHNPAAEGYAPLTPDAFGLARRAELTTAVHALGGAQVHEAQLGDEQVTVAQAKTAIAALVASVGPNPGVYAPSWKVDDNPDHRAAGQALRELAAERPAVYGDVAWYILPRYWSDPRLKQVASYWDAPTDRQISNRVRNACRAYAAWHPPYSYAIGYHSVDDMFGALDTNPRSLLHR